jgi:predicted  nucleic acid-binding Zn-ribbon protein
MSVSSNAYPVGREHPVSALTGELRRLEDGTAFFGQLGELAYDRDEDRVQCHLCGEWFSFLGGAHLRRTHGWTLAEYREAFHLPAGVATWSRELSLQQSAYARSQIERKNGFGEGVRVPIAPRALVRVPRWRSLAARPDLARELHPKRTPTVDDLTEIAAKSSRKLWWRCGRCGHEWEATVGARAAGSGCPECDRRRKRGPRSVGGERSLQALHPDLFAEWHPTRNSELDPATISPGSKHRAWWRCAACGHDWQAAVHNRARGSGCPVCGLEQRARTQSDVEPARSLALKHPDIAAELHAQRNPRIEPTRLGARSSLKLWWQCASCGHEWKTSVATRTAGGSGCPVCGLKRRARTQREVEPARSLAVKHPDIAAELHPQRNPGIEPTRVGARSSRKLWWQCGTCGHEWKTAVSTRTDGSGCPACYRAKRRGARASTEKPASASSTR